MTRVSGLDGVRRIAVPIGVNNIESVNVYVIADAGRITLIDCGIWRPETELDSDLAAAGGSGRAVSTTLERGLNEAGYALRDVSRIIVTHAHIDHYGLAGRLMIEDGPCTVTEIADRLVAKAVLSFQRNLALSETLAHIAYLRWSGQGERRMRGDGVYEWYSTAGRNSPLPTPR